MKRTIPKYFRQLAVFAMAALIFAAAAIDGQPSDAEPFQKFEKRYKKFSIRVTASIEKNAWFASGADYVFESTAIGSDQWKPIMTFRHDDAVDIPTDQIRFLNEKVAYVFMGPMFAVTINEGKSWSVWDASSHMRSAEGYQLFKYPKVEIGADGRGVMIIEPLKERYGPTRRLSTKDYGQHWAADEPTR